MEHRKKVGIATVYTGYNYGSSLQAFAGKQILERLGYAPELLKLKGSLLPGRDIRIRKLLTLLGRSLVRPGGFRHLKKYGQSIAKTLPEGAAEAFLQFQKEALQPRELSYSTLKRLAKGEEFSAFLCGSDQVWNAATLYVDPFYYLRFAPECKRIAFAPSFGRDRMPDYNQKKIAGYIAQIPYRSVRELSGRELIRSLTGLESRVLPDPTLVLSREEWVQALELKAAPREPYLLAYFLDSPSEKARLAVEKLSRQLGLSIVALPYVSEESPWNAAAAGPREFVEYIKNAEFVCTDSFHGTAFSLNFNVPFYTFRRNYQSADSQSARLHSLLALTGMEERYEPELQDLCWELSFASSNEILSRERQKAYDYLQTALRGGEVCYEE